MPDIAMLSMTRTSIFCRRLYRSAHAEDYVQWAVDQLVAGRDSPNLRILAGLMPPLDRDEVERHFQKVLLELDIELPSEEECIAEYCNLVDEYAAAVCEEILKGELSPSSEVRLLSDMERYVFEEEECLWNRQQWWNLEMVASLVRDRVSTWGMGAQHMDDMIRKEAQSFLKKLKSEDTD